MKLNLVIIFLVTVIGSLGTIFWKVDRDFYSQKIRWNESQSRVQISAIAHSIESEIEGLTQVLDLAYPIISEMKRDYTDDQVFSKFQMISKVLKSETGDLILENKFFLEKTTTRNWAANYTYFALKNLKTHSFEKTKIQVLQDPQRKPWLLLVVKSNVTQNVYAAILGKDFFQAIVDQQKGQLGKVSILNDQGQVIAHSVSEYIGMDLREDDLVKEIMTNSSQNGSGFFSGLEGEQNHGFYDKSEKNDLYVTISTPVADLMIERSGLKKKFIFLGIGILFVGVAFLFLMDPSAKVEDQNEELLSLLNQAQKKKEDSAHKKEQKEKADAAVPMAARPVEKPKDEIKMMPPAPAGKDDPKTKAGFDQLFGERKIEEAFDMIDNLDSPPRELKVIDDPEELKTTLTTEVAAVALAPTAPTLEANERIEIVAPVVKPLIQMQRRESKLDQFEVVIRKPGEKL